MRRKPGPTHEFERGAVLVETALVVGIILTFLLFSVQTGILGFLQVTADAASYVGARVSTVGSTGSNPQSYTASTFSQVKSTDVTINTAPAPVATVAVDYGYNNPSNPNYANSQFQRNGGYSVLEPVQSTVNVKPSRIVNIDGHAATVNGSDTEALWTECGVHFNVANSNSGCGGSNQPTNFSGNYFQTGENTPPYFVGYNEFSHCTAGQAWGYNGGGCPSAVDYIGVGVAEQLDSFNWTRTGAGMSGPNTTFFAVECHQQTFANLANFFYNNIDLNTLYGKYQTTLYTWVNSGPTSMKTYSGFATNILTPTDTSGATADALIQKTYGWDTVVQAGESNDSQLGSNSTTPEAGC